MRDKQKQQEAQVRYRANNKDKIKEQNRIWNINNREKTKAYKRAYHAEYIKRPTSKYKALETRAKKSSIPLNISLQEYIILFGDNNPCYYCNGYLDTDIGYGHRLDRIDNSKGYSLDNVVICCGFCNQIKQHLLTQDENLAAIQAIINLRKANLG